MHFLKKPRQRAAALCLCVLLCAVPLSGCVEWPDVSDIAAATTATATTPAQTEGSTSAEATTVEATTAEATTAEATTAEATTAPTTVPTTTTSTTTTATVPATTSASTTPVGRTVYITPSGKCYHYSADCAGKNAMARSLSDVEGRYRPCKKCT